MESTPTNRAARHPSGSRDAVTVRESGSRPYAVTASAGRHLLILDEPSALGGQDAGPSPFQALSAALGACTVMTLRMYADRKGWPLGEISVEVSHSRIPTADSGRRDFFMRDIRLGGALTDEQRARLLEIADRCPVSHTLQQGAIVSSRLAP